MTSMHISLPEDVQTRLAARAREQGFPSVEAYVESLLRADVGDDEVVRDGDLEALLLRRLDGSAGIQCTPAFIEQFKQEVSRRRQARP